MVNSMVAILARFTLVISFFCLGGDGVLLAADQSKGIRFQGVDYLALNALCGLVGGEATLTERGRGMRLSLTDGSWWEFANGGDRLVDSTGKEELLKHPILVIDGNHYVPLDECAERFGYQVNQDLKGWSVSFVGKSISVDREDLKLKYLCHQVAKLEAVHRVVRLSSDVPARTTLHDERDRCLIPRGAVFVVRRKVEVDGTPYLVATDANSLRSYLFESEVLKLRSVPIDGEGTLWYQCRQWCDQEARNELGLRHGTREHKPAVSLSVDMCWSLRNSEWEFFDSLAKEVQVEGGSVALFMSGRWIDQHPAEMERLIELGRNNRLELSFSQHSYAHPKEQPFMNSTSLEEFGADMLKVEERLLEWGCVPTVFYRFPGLVHDARHLQKAIAMDVFPVDCDSWMALIGKADQTPSELGNAFTQPVQSGSIILVHGNSNEHVGIQRWIEWRKEHPDWKLRPLEEMLNH